MDPIVDGRPVEEPTGLAPYLSEWHERWLHHEPGRRWARVPGTLVFADVSGFTPLAERLARRGKVGAEELTDTLNTVFSDLLEVAARFGGDCLKFGGDALLLLFSGPGHPRRGAAAAHAMQRALRGLRRRRSGAGLAKLDISMGVHSGEVHGFLVGASHRELILAGPATSRTLALEAAASGGQILVGDGTAATLDLDDVEELDGGRLVLRRSPAAALHPRERHGSRPGVELGLPVRLRAHLDGSAQAGEHRLANIAFVKLGGTDELLDELGPRGLAEELDQLVRLVQAHCEVHDVTFLATDVDANGGKVLLATGMPTASPDDEDRLLLTVREILDGAGSMRLRVRAGAHRGRVFAVDLGSPSRRTFTVMGDAVNLAARVMARAEWGQVLATQEVLERRRTDFDLVELDPFTVKGKSQPVQAAAVGAARGVREDVAAPGTMIGRGAEVALIKEAFASAHEGSGRVVEIAGEPGIGKSTLVATVTALDHGLSRLTFEAGRYSLATPYFALRRGLREAMGLTLHAPSAEVAEALAQVIADAAPDLAPWMPLLGVPLGLELPDTPQTMGLDPASRQATLHSAVVGLMTKVLDRPTLITVEDAHWLDAASCELLSALLVEVAHRPWAVVVTRRDVVGGLELADSDHLVRRRLEPLDKAALVELARIAAGEEPLPPGVIEDLVERSGGNPLFLRELVNASVAGALSELPETIEAVVAASIDTLPAPARALLRHAAVLGGHLPIDVLATMVGEPVDAVTARVAELAHFLTPPTNGMLRFRHILLRDVAYEGLPFRARRSLHERAGDILEASTGQPESMAELLAIHFHRAGQLDRSWRYARVAGARAQRNGATVEAAAFFDDALEAARHLPGVSSLDQAEVAERLGDTCELGGRYDRSSAAYQQARRLLGPDPLGQGRLCRKIGYVRDHQGRYQAAQRWFTRGLASLDTGAEVPAAAAQALRAELITAAVSSKIRQGRHVRAVPQIERAIREAAASGDRAALAHAYFVYDQLLVDQGRYAEARHSQLAAAIYEELGDHRGAAAAHNEVGNTAYWLGHWDEAVAAYERAIEADQRAGALVYNAIYLNNIGEIRSDQGRWSEAEALIEEAHRLWTAGGWRAGTGWALSNLGRVAARSGRTGEARARLGEASEVLTAIGADAMLLETEARELERRVLAGEHEAALAVADGLLARAERVGLVSVVDLVRRLHGYAWAQAGDPQCGAELIERSLAASRARGAEYEVALSAQALARVGRLLGRDDATEHEVEAAVAFTRLGVVATAEVPLPGA